MLAKISSGLDEGNYYVGELPTITCSSRGINVLAILNSGQKLSPNALRSAYWPHVIFFSLLACLADYLVMYLTVSAVPYLHGDTHIWYLVHILNFWIFLWDHLVVEDWRVLKQESVWSIVEKVKFCRWLWLPPFCYSVCTPTALSMQFHFHLHWCP